MTFSALDSTLTGGLFATDAMRAVFSDAAKLDAMLRAEAALARAEARFGLAPHELADAIETITPADLDLTQIGRATALAGVPTIPFVRAVEALLPPELARAFHKGATTQDILDTALVLQVRRALALVESDLAAILEGLAELAATHRGTPCVGRSYGQHAAPVTFGYKLAVWIAGVSDVARLLPALESRVLVASLGGPVGTLTALGRKGPGVAEAFADELDLEAAPIAWHVRRARIAELGAWLATLIGALAKIATDVAHLASTEVGEVAEPHVPGRGGSSAMPHKRNPVSSTIILAAHGAAKGFLVTLIDAMAAQHERPAGAWHAEWHALPQLFGLVSGALAEARALAQGLVVDAERMRANIDATKGLLFADAVAAHFAPLIGRGEAHALVERAADAVREGAGSLRGALLAMSALDDETARRAIADAFDLAPAIETAAAFVDPVIAEAEEVLTMLRSPLDG